MTIARKYGYRFRIVTLDGQVVNAGGSMTGGSSAKGTGLLSRRAEIESIQKEAAVLGEKARQARELFRQLQQEAAAAEADLTGTRGELATAQEDRIRLEGEVRRLAEQEEASRRAAEEAAAEITTLNERAEECKRTAAGAAAEAAEATERKTALEAELQAASGGRQELTAKREELSAKIAEIKLEVVAYNKEIEAWRGPYAICTRAVRTRPGTRSRSRRRSPPWPRPTRRCRSGSLRKTGRPKRSGNRRRRPARR